MAANHKREDAGRLYLLVRHLARELSGVDVACGVSPARFSVLAHLAFHGIDNVSALARAESVSRPAMTRLVKDMERAGLVRRFSDSRDARAVLVALTPKGRALLDRTRRKKIALVASYLEPLDERGRAAVRLMLETLSMLGARQR